MEHICHNKKCIFIHVPKVAGRSVAESLGWGRESYGGHHQAVLLKETYANVYDESMLIGRIQINLNNGKKRKFLYFQADYKVKQSDGG